MESVKIGILPGSFDPVHIGHIQLAMIGFFEYDLDYIYVIPSYRHPFGKQCEATFEQRIQMTQSAFHKVFGENKISIESFERDIALQKEDNSPVYGIDVINYVQKYIKNFHNSGYPFEYTDKKLYFLVGKDVQKDIEDGKWKSSDEIKKNTTIIVAPREVGSESSTLIRRKIKDNCSYSDVENMISSQTWFFIKKNGLYS